MGRLAFASSVLMLALLSVASSAFAHHPPRFERCHRFVLTGQLERIEWVNPHVLLHIRSEDGVSHRIGWLNPRRLERAGIERTTLALGEHVVIEGGTRVDEVIEEPVLLSIVRRPRDGWEWSQPLQGC